MSGTYIEGHTVHLPDVNGFPSTIPTRVLHLVAHAANVTDSGRVTWGIRTFNRDVLNGARDLLDRRDHCTYEDEHTACDEPAVFDLANPRPRCHLHPKEA